MISFFLYFWCCLWWSFCVGFGYVSLFIISFGSTIPFFAPTIKTFVPIIVKRFIIRNKSLCPVVSAIFSSKNSCGVSNSESLKNTTTYANSLALKTIKIKNIKALIRRTSYILQMESIEGMLGQCVRQFHL